LEIVGLDVAEAANLSSGMRLQAGYGRPSNQGNKGTFHRMMTNGNLRRVAMDSSGERSTQPGT
jgi:hypothetical protein